MEETLSSKPIYKRILLKLSGEALQGDYLGIDGARLSRIAQEVASVVQLGVQVTLVIGGGNFIRGADLCASGLVDRISADQMGMLATVINGLALRDALVKQSLRVTLMSAFAVPSLTDQYDRSVAKEKLEQGGVVIFSAGTGNPLVTTDSAAALRGIEIDADIVLKATKVEGVFDDDPIKNPKAERFEHLDYNEVISRRLGVMDLSAILLCQDHRLPIRVFNMNKQDALKRIMLGEEIGTLIEDVI
ncbi:MAG TPA: UMP kinase [Gammaproteobacteria bacterium]|jgi:uridylate kinase|nr:UMP kinase [Gammaproteobacteria bacterium]